MPTGPVRAAFVAVVGLLAGCGQPVVETAAPPSTTSTTTTSTTTTTTTTTTTLPPVDACAEPADEVIAEGNESSRERFWERRREAAARWRSDMQRYETQFGAWWSAQLWGGPAAALPPPTHPGGDPNETKLDITTEDRTPLDEGRGCVVIIRKEISAPGQGVLTATTHRVVVCADAGGAFRYNDEFADEASRTLTEQYEDCKLLLS